MTVGDKIKYYRAQFDITSKQLSEITGIPSANIRQIETGKYNLTDENAKKIANVFGVSTLAITDKLSGFSFETVGDVMGLIIYLVKNDILTIDGQRDTENCISTQSACLRFTQMFNHILSARINDEKGSISDIFIQFKNQLYFSELLEWDKYRYMFNEINQTVNEDEIINYLEVTDIREKILFSIETIELRLQMIPYLINSENNKTSIRSPKIVILDRSKTIYPFYDALSLLNKIKKDTGK